MAITSFKKNTVTSLPRLSAAALAVTPFGESSFVTGHADGAVTVWDLETCSARALKGHQAPVVAVAADRRGRVFSGGADGQVRVWNLERGNVTMAEAGDGPVRALDVYVDGRVAVACGQGGPARCRILILDPESGACDALDLEARGALRALSVYFDGRVMAGLDVREDVGVEGTPPGQGADAPVGEGSRCRPGSLVVLDPRPGFTCYNLLSGHGAETLDCVSMGPRIVSCGTETSGERTLRIWGTATYVAKELGKLRLMPESMGKPPYYRSLF
jgi:WD40 repeat protein